MPIGPKTPVRRLVSRPPTPASEYEDTTPAPPARIARPAVNRPAPVDQDDDGGRAPNRRDRSEQPTYDVASMSSEGWEGVDQLKKEMPSDFAQEFRVGTSWTLIKFLQDKPFASYKQHWCQDWLPQGSKYSHVCPKLDCPLCAVGDKPGARICFNIVDFSDPEKPVNSVLAVGIRLSNMVQDFSKDPKTTPINRDDLYFKIKKTTSDSGSKSTKGGGTQTNLADVKARDLLDDWGFEPLTDDELAYFEENAWTRDKFVIPTSPAKLLEVANAIPSA